MAHGHTETHSDDHADHGFAHVISPAILIAVFFALIILTILTVVLNDYDLGPIEIWISMGIATVKAALVTAFFMHMIHDKPINLVVFFFSFAFVSLFIGFTLLDRQQYSPEIIEHEYYEIQKEEAAKPPAAPKTE